MKSTNTYGLQFFVRKNKIIDGKAPIYAKLTVNKGSKELVVFKERIDVASWDASKGNLKNKSPEAKLINNRLDAIRNKFYNH